MALLKAEGVRGFVLAQVGRTVVRWPHTPRRTPEAAASVLRVSKEVPVPHGGVGKGKGKIPREAEAVWGAERAREA